MPIRRAGAFSSASQGSPAYRRLPRKPRNIVPMWKRSALAPFFWRVVDDAGADSFGRNLPPPSTKMLELWRLTLDAKSIPHVIVGHSDHQRVFVPPLYEALARTELAAVVAENFPVFLPSPPPRHNAHWVLFSVLVLMFWHGFYMGWWSLPLEHLPDPDYWLEHGKVDVYRIRILREWWRLGTALTLHADSLHLFGNLLFGAPFLILLARRLGLGMSLGLSLLAGLMGNALNVSYRPLSHTSVGFSTALFGMIGLLCADIAVRERGHGLKRRVLLPLAAGLALLALLGSEGERTDYAAHIFGLFSGFTLGAANAFAVRRFGSPPRIFEWGMGIAVPLFLLWCWEKAFA